MIVVEDSSVPLLHLSVSTRTGTLIDPPGKEGATVLLMRLLRRATQGLTTEALDEKVDTLGSTLGIDVSRSVVGLHGGCISRSSNEFLELAQRLITAPDFREIEFERIREEALADWKTSLDSDSTIARRVFSQNLFFGHAYGRLSSGTPESLRRVEINDLKKIYDQLFVKDTLHFSFAGDIERETAARYCEETNRLLPERSVEAVEESDPIGPQGRQLIFVDKPERTQTQILIGGLGTHPRDLDHTALFVGHTIFGGTFSGRLSREVRGKRGWSYGAYSSLPFDRKRQAFSLWTFPAASDAAACIQLELKMLHDLIDRGITKKELRAAKKYLSNSHVFSVDTAAKRASLQVDELTFDLPKGYFEEHVARVEAVTLAEVNDALKARLSIENQLIVVLGTEKEIGDDVRAAVEPTESRTISFLDT